MCLIAYSHDGKPITRETFDLADLTNPDGIGVMSADGFAKFLGPKRRQKAWRYLERRVFARGIPYAVHFRWTTHGENTRANTHPHLSPDGRFLVMHNGVMREFDDPTGVRSDTSLFVETWFADAPEIADAEAFTKFREDTETYIGSGNKLVAFEIASGRFAIFNERMGDRGQDGIWYSNTYSLPPTIDPWSYQGYNRIRSRHGAQWDEYATPIGAGTGGTAGAVIAHRWRPADIVDRWLDRARSNGDLGKPRTWQDDRDAELELESIREEARLQAWLAENRARNHASGPAALNADAGEDAGDYTPERLRREQEEAEEVYLYASR